MSQHDTLTLREALRSIQYEAASLADAQVIALQALNATYPARAALSATQPAQAAQGEPTLKPEQVVEAFNLHFPNTRMAQAYIGFATDLWALGVKAQRAWQPAAGADVPPAQPAPVVPEGWEIREEATWVYFKRPDGFCQAVTPNDSHQSHAQTLHMLMRAMLAATPTPPAQAAADARDAERWRMAVLIQSETLTPPDHRKNQQALNAYIKALGGGIDFQGAIDAALATHQQRQGGAAIAASGRKE